MGLFNNISNVASNCSALTDLINLVRKMVEMLGEERIKDLVSKASTALDKYLREDAEKQNTDVGTSGSPKPVPAVEDDVQPSAPAPAPIVEDKDAVEFSALDWCWGGFKGGKAKRVDGVEISKLAVGAKQMTYKWVSGGCEKLGASSKSDASCIAAFFCRIGGKWRGGKVDWISTSRTSRSWENIRGGYNGWDKDALKKADAYAFVIVSKDGKKRTNVIAKGI